MRVKAEECLLQQEIQVAVIVEIIHQVVVKVLRDKQAVVKVLLEKPERNKTALSLFYF